MRTRLDFIKNWESLAEVAGYSATRLARRCGVSLRQLERFFLEKHKQSPHKWLHELRLRRACELMSDGCAVKKAAELLGYRDASYFSHDFKRRYQISPSNFAARGAKAASNL